MKLYNDIDGYWIFELGAWKKPLDVLTFSAGESHVNLPKDITFGEVEITARINSVKLWMELLSILSALAYNTTVEKIHLNIPYFPGSRQDRTDGFAPFTLQMNVDMLECAVVTRIEDFSLTTVDMHSDIGIDLLMHRFDAENLQSYELSLKSYIKANINYLVVHDKGAKARVRNAQTEMWPDARLLQADKARDFNTGKLTKYEFVEGEITEPGNILVVDDICDGGYTFVLLAKALKEKWGDLSTESNLMLYVTHGIFSKTPEVLEDFYRRIYTTDSFYHPHYGQDFPYVTEIKLHF